MKHVMEHDLSPELARKAADRAWQAYQEKYASYNPTITWQGDKRAQVAFHVKGVTLNGVIELMPRGISFDLDVPFVFKMFKGKAVSIMERELRFWVDKAKKGEL